MKTGIGYKVFKVKKGKLYPPKVNNSGNRPTEIGVWLNAEEGEFAGYSKTGRPQVRQGNSNQTLSFRPGWHMGDLPRAEQFDTKAGEFPKNFVWALCEYSMDINYQEESDARGYERTSMDENGNITITVSDTFQHSLAGLPRIPENGYYRYRTNPDPNTPEWIIAGKMKVIKLLSDEEVNKILVENGMKPINRKSGNKTLKELGLED